MVTVVRSFEESFKTDLSVSELELRVKSGKHHFFLLNIGGLSHNLFGI